MKIFWRLKAFFRALRYFIIAIPIVCLAATIYGCWEGIKYNHFSLPLVIGILINFGGFILFSYLVGNLFFETAFKLDGKKWDILHFIFLTIIVGGVILFILGYANIILTFNTDFPFLIIIFLAFTLLSFLLWFFKNRVLLHSTPLLTITYRIIIVAVITITSLLYTFFGIKSCFPNADTTYDYISLSTALVSLFIVYYYFYHHFSFIKYKRSQYLLFLRNFSMDDRIAESSLMIELKHTCNRLQLYLMRIGNPKNFFYPSAGKTYYLRTTNWQKQLHSHIKEAKIIFVVISSSDGVFWEIFNHVQYSSKFIFHISDIAIMREELKDGKYDKIKHTQLGSILYFICNIYKGPFSYNYSGVSLISDNNIAIYYDKMSNSLTVNNNLRYDKMSISFTVNNDNLIISDELDRLIEYLLTPNTIKETKALDFIKIEYDKDLKRKIIPYEQMIILINDDNDHN